MMVKLEKDLYASPMKTVGGNEGDKCNYPTRLDTYGKGCYFNCKYCYAKSLLDFRKLWNPLKPNKADLKDIIKIVRETPSGSVLRLGGMTDCFQPRESADRVTYNTIRLLNRKKIHYLIVTKNDMITRREYLEILDKDLAHIQISIPSTEDKVLNFTDNAPSFERRKKAVETLYEAGFDVSIRCSPLLSKGMNYDKLNNINCDKILVEFLRVNSKIHKALKGLVNIDEYTVKENNYRHLPLNRKLELLKRICYPQVTVCEDVTSHYNYFRENVNYNTEDCCNLRL